MAEPSDDKDDDEGTPEETVLERAKRRFQQAMDAEEKNRERERDDMRFLASTPDDNFQWPQNILDQRSKPGQEGGIRPCLTINKMRPHQNQVLNEMRMNRPQITVRPGDSRASAEVAKVMNGWLRHVQVASEADLAYDKASEWQTGAGEGFFRLFTQFCDEMSCDQDVVFAPCPDRMKVYLDPIGLRMHPAGRKCKWGFIVEDMPKDDYESEHGKDHPIDWNLAARGDTASSWFPSGTTVRVAEYFEIEETDAVLLEFKLPDGSKVTSLEGKPLPAGVTAVQKPSRTRKTKIPRCIWRKLNGQKVLSEKEMPTRYIPIVRVVGNEFVIDGELMVDGMVRPGKDAQRMYNYNASTEIEVNALAPKAPITAMVEQIKGHEDKYRTANQVPLAYLPYNALYDDNGQIVSASPPQRMQPPSPPTAFIQAKIGADQDLKSTMGQWGPALGEPSGEKSGKAISARQRESDVGTFHYTDNLARALRYAGTIALDMLPEIIEERQILRILGEDGEPDHIIVDPDMDVPYKEEVGPDGKKTKIYNFSLGKYEVVVNTGPSFTTRRAEAAEFLTTAVQSAKDPATANVLTYLAMKNQDWSGAEEATTLLKTLLPPPAAKALEGDANGAQAPLPPEVEQMVTQLKQAVGQAHGQLDAAKQALAERDATLKDLQGQIKGRNVDAMAKMYEADKKALSEITKAQADVIIARADAATAANAAPDNPSLQGLVQALDSTIAEMQGKIDALAQSSAQIAEQLQGFEIAARMPAEAAA